MATKIFPSDIDQTQTFTNLTTTTHLLGDGTVGAPALAFTSETTSGVFRAGAGILAISTSGAERFRIDSSTALFQGTVRANIGMRSDNTGGSDFLDMNGTSAGTVNVRFSPSGATTNAARVRGTLNGTDTDLNFLTGGATRMTLDKTGKLGLNVAPSTKVLDVRGASDGLFLLAPTDDVNPTNDIFQITNAALSNVLSISKSGTIKTVNGTQSLPAYSFSTHTGTGIYSDASGFLNLSINGTWVAGIDNTGVVLNGTTKFYNGDGTLALPSITFINQPGVGIYRAGSNDMRFVAGGSEYLKMQGTLLQPQVQTTALDGTVTNPSYGFFNNANMGMYRVGANDLGLAVAGTLCLEIATSKTIFNASVVAGNGTASVPTFSFGSDQSTGIYRVGAGTLGISSGGTAQWSINNTIQAQGTGQAIYNSSGTVSAPTYSFVSASSSGLYSSAANTVDIATAGVHALQLDSSQNLQVYGHIGMNGTNKYIFNNDGTAATPAYTFQTDADTGFYRQASGRTGYTANGFEAVRLGSTNAATSDAIVQTPIQFNAGGNGCNTAITMQTTIAVTTNVYISAVNFGLCLVTGNDGTNYFVDVILTSYNSGAAVVIAQKTHQGSPAARTYVSDATGLKLSMASGSYKVCCTVLDSSMR